MHLQETLLPGLSTTIKSSKRGFKLQSIQFLVFALLFHRFISKTRSFISTVAIIVALNAATTVIEALVRRGTSATTAVVNLIVALIVTKVRRSTSVTTAVVTLTLALTVRL